jgi:hypothetical protein
MPALFEEPTSQNTNVQRSLITVEILEEYVYTLEDVYDHIKVTNKEW